MGGNHYSWGIAFLVLVAVFVFFILKLKAWWQSIIVKRRFAKGIKKEQKAKKVLKRNGYVIEKEQMPLKNSYSVGDEKYSVDLNVDYLVSKKGRKYLVEVKSGIKASSVRNKETRRQLLEYAFLNPYDGLLFVNMEDQTIKEVVF